MAKETEIVYNYNRMTQENDFENQLPISSESRTTSSETSSSNKHFLEFLKKDSLKILKYLLLLLIFSWYIICVISLTKTDYIQERNLCRFSDSWTYLLISLLIDLGFLESIKKYIWNLNISIPEEIPTCYLVRFAVKCLLIFVWGSLILYPFSCTDKLKNTMLFWLSLYNYLLNFIFGGLTGIILLRRFFEKRFSEEITDEQLLALSQELGRGESQSAQERGGGQYSIEI